MKRVLLSIVFAAALLSATAQKDSLPTLSGVVSTAQGKENIPMANVILRNIYTGAVHCGTSTNFHGKYKLDSIEPGIYDVEASFTGMKKEIYKKLAFQKGDSLILDFFMAEDTQEIVCFVFQCIALSKSDSMLLAERNFDRERLEVFPNPATDRLQINIQSPGHFEYRFTLVDMQGRPVKQITCGKSLKKELMVKNLPRGMYHYSLTGLGGVFKEGKVLLH